MCEEEDRCFTEIVGLEDLGFDLEAVAVSLEKSLNAETKVVNDYLFNVNEVTAIIVAGDVTGGRLVQAFKKLNFSADQMVVLAKVSTVSKRAPKQS